MRFLPIFVDIFNGCVSQKRINNNIHGELQSAILLKCASRRICEKCEQIHRHLALAQNSAESMRCTIK